eukprot:362287-Chlamydomonas_euryale.AAC.1
MTNTGTSGASSIRTCCLQVHHSLAPPPDIRSPLAPVPHIHTPFTPPRHPFPQHLHPPPDTFSPPHAHARPPTPAPRHFLPSPHARQTRVPLRKGGQVPHHPHLSVAQVASHDQIHDGHGMVATEGRQWDLRRAQPASRLLFKAALSVRHDSASYSTHPPKHSHAPPPTKATCPPARSDRTQLAPAAMRPSERAGQLHGAPRATATPAPGTCARGIMTHPCHAGTCPTMRTPAPCWHATHKGFECTTV